MAQDVQGMLIRIEATSAQLRQELARAEKAVGASASKIDKELINVDRAVDRAMDAIGASVAKAHAGLDQLGDNLSSTAVAAKSMTSAVSSAGNASAGAARGFKATAGAVNAAGLSAAQYSQAMRMLPMQLTDVVTSLASGMPVWMVAIQQGGQVRDSFGGIGAAARAAISAINPLTAAIGVAAASIGTLVYAYQGGQGEALAFNRALTLTGNAAGTSVDVLMETASALDQVSGTQRQAAAALAEIVATGKIASDQFANVAAAAMAMEQATGKAVADTVKEFAALADEPAAASAKLNQQYNYLTASVYKQIAALEQQGDKLGAAKLAMEEYGNAAKERSDDIEQSLGYIDRALNGLKAGWREMWDAAFDIGRPETLEEKLAGVEQAINQRKNNIYVGSVFDWGPSAEELERQRQGIQLSIQQRDLDAAFISLRAQNAQQEIKAAEEERKAAEQRQKSYGSMLASLQQTTALHGQASEVARVRYAIEHGELSKLTEAQKAALLVAAQEADAKEAAAEAGRKSAASLREQKSALDALIAKYDPAAKAQAEYEKGIALADEALRKNKYTTEQYQAVVQGLYTDLNKPIWDKHNEASGKAREALKKIDDQLNAVRDRLDPARVATRRLTDEKKLLKDALDKNLLSLEEYQQRLQQLDDEYARNQKSTSEWTQWTESALERVDGAFADAWRNIGDGFKGFADNLKNAFAQMLAELAHMAITRKIVLQVGAALGIGGAAGQATSMLGGGSGGGFDFGQLLNYGQTAYSMLTGVGPAALAGYQSGGLMGGLQGVGSYYGNLASSAWGTVSGWFGGGAASSAAAAQAAGAAAGNSLGVNAGVYASGSGAAAGGMSLSALATPAAIVAAVYAAVSAYNAQKDGYRPEADIYKSGDREFKGATGIGNAVTNHVVYTAAKINEELARINTQVFGKGFIGRIANIGSTIVGTTIEALFGGGWKTKDVGLALSATGGDFVGQQYEYMKRKGGLLGKNKKKTVYTDLDPETAATLQAAYDATESTVAGLFAELSLSVEEGTLDGLQIARKQISTKGKTDEEIQKAISEWFGEAAEAMNTELNKVFATGLDLDLAGMQAFVGNLQGVNEVVRNLNVEMYDSTVAGGKLAQKLSELAGGFENLAGSAAVYYEQFFSAFERLEDGIEGVQRAFEDAGVTLAATRQDYRDIVEAIDMTGEAGQKLFTQLMGLAGQADAYYDALEARANEAINAAGAAFSVLQSAIGREVSTLQAQYQAAQASANQLLQLSNTLDSALRAMRLESDAFDRSRRQQAQAQLSQALAVGRSGGSLKGLDVSGALSELGRDSTQFYGTFEEYARDYWKTSQDIRELGELTGDQISVEEKTLAAIETQIAYYDQMLIDAQMQYNALLGIDASVDSVAAALSGFKAAVSAAQAAKDAVLAPTSTKDLIAQTYKDVLGREGGESEVSYWLQRIGAGTASTSNLADLFKTSDEYKKKVPGFASGGFHAGGLRLVGERGPELEVTGPSRIYSASQTAAMLGGGGDAAKEVRALRADMAGMTDALRSVAKHTMQTAKRVEFLERWDYDGLPTERATA